jgi:subtilisin family serine protease
MASHSAKHLGSGGRLRGAVLLLALCLGSAQADEVNDPFFQSSGSWGNAHSDQWGLHAIGLTDPSNRDSAWNLEDGSSDAVIVAVIDTGLDYFHPDIARGNIWRNADEVANGVDDDDNGYVDDLIGWNFLDGNNNPWDYSGHGTHIAGIIGAAVGNGAGIAGINRGVQLMPLKIMNFVGRGRTIRMAEAIYYAVANGARVINLSLGAEQVSAVQQAAIDYAFANGVVVVAAAGNMGKDAAVFSPAGLPNVINVAAVGPDGRRAPFSNWGDTVDISAPGVDILSLRARNTDLALLANVDGYTAAEGFVGPESQYYRADGTSFAAPFVSGVASLIIARHPGYTAEQVRRMLLHSAADIAPAGVDRETGFGMLDARAALAADPEFFIDAHISGVQVAQVDGTPSLSVLGSLDADQLDRAWIELGQGEAPAEWKKVSREIREPVGGALIDNLDINLLRASKVWTLKLVVRHKNRKTREYIYLLRLG